MIQIKPNLSLLSIPQDCELACTQLNGAMRWYLLQLVPSPQNKQRLIEYIMYHLYLEVSYIS